MAEQYIEMNPKKLGYFFGLVTGVALIVTAVYWAIFGFDTWQEEMGQGMDLMLAATVPPVVSGSPQATGPGLAGQYVCPRDGAIGLPRFDAGGVPYCPVCGQVMNFYTAPSQTMTLAGAG